MSRTGTIDEKLYSEIIMRSVKKGYEVNDLRIVIQ
jgi:lipocalin